LPTPAQAPRSGQLFNARHTGDNGPMLGATVGNFRITSRLGQGGMGTVFLAEHMSIKTKVAIKVLLPHISANTEHVQRFFNEAVAVSRIKHSGIAKIFDVGFLPDRQAYLVMEFLDGETLTSRIMRSGRLSAGSVGEIGRQVANILEATHHAQIIHRDLKPDNVFLVSDAEMESGERVKILDFGIAKLGGAGLTGTSGGSMGTPGYMAPEQWQDSKTVDWRADAYSLGCLAFEMATGRPPFVVQSIAEACTKHLNETPVPVRSLAPELPVELEHLVARLL
jgi:serine/threonine protein kinase